MALTLHGLLFSLRLTHNPAVTLPKPMAVQRIAVSLGARPAPVKPEVVAALDRSSEQLEPIPKKQPSPEPLPGKKLEQIKKIQPQIIKSRPVRKHTVVQQVNPPSTPKTAHPTVAVVHQETGEDEQPETASRVIQEASPLYHVNPPPKYPSLARRREYEGVVILEALVNISGRVKELRVFTSSGHHILDKAALKTVRKWKFQPGTLGGIVQEMRVNVPIRFQLTGK